MFFGTSCTQQMKHHVLNKPPQINFKPQKNFPMVVSLSLPPFFLPQTNHWLSFIDRWHSCSNQSLSHLHFCLDSKFGARFPIWDSQIAQKNGICFAIYVCFVNESLNSYNYLEWKEILMIFHAIQTTENCFLAQGHYQT